MYTGRACACVPDVVGALFQVFHLLLVVLVEQWRVGDLIAHHDDLGVAAFEVEHDLLGLPTCFFQRHSEDEGQTYAQAILLRVRKNDPYGNITHCHRELTDCNASMHFFMCRLALTD